MPGKDIDPDVAEELAFYKSQVATLESELADFQASSRELESELEKELEQSEKAHRQLRDKNEALRYEVEEWKTKYRQSKAEANTAQNALQKEITTLREQNRTFQLKLRDMEVSNDTFEMQERIVKSSLEDLETKYNVSIERGVMLEAEIHASEADREALRIEVQRLRDELSDLRVEAEITQEKLHNALAVSAKYGVRPGYQSPISEDNTSDVAPSTPKSQNHPPKTTRSGVTSPTPPSPPMSETSGASSRIPTPFDPSATPRPAPPQQLPQPKVRHSRVQSGNTTAIPLPQSKSLHQIRGLIGQMQRLEQRVQSARSKLPAPATSPPPRSSAGAIIPNPPQNYQAFLPPTSNSATSRPSLKSGRPSSNISTSSADTAASSSTGYGRVSRLSFGSAMSAPSSNYPSSSGTPSNSSGKPMHQVQIASLDKKLEQMGLGGTKGQGQSEAAAAQGMPPPSSTSKLRPTSSRASSSSNSSTATTTRASLGGNTTINGLGNSGNSMPQPKRASRLSIPSAGGAGRLTPTLSSRQNYTSSMKSIVYESPGPGTKKRSIHGLNSSYKDTSHHNLSRRETITSDDESDIPDQETTSPKPVMIPSPVRRGTIGGSLAAAAAGSAIPAVPRNNSFTAGNAPLPRKSLGGSSAGLGLGMGGQPGGGPRRVSGAFGFGLGTASGALPSDSPAAKKVLQRSAK